MAVKAKASLTVTDLTDVLRVTPFWRAQSSTAATPAKPTTTSTSAAVSDWSKTMPAYDSSKRCYTCTRSERGDGSCYWSDVTEDQGWRGANVANSTATNASQTAKDAKQTADGISVGGRNLVLGTGVAATWTAPAIAAGSYKAWDPYDMTAAWSAIGVKAGDPLTLTFDWAVTGAPAGATFRVGTDTNPWEFFGLVVTLAAGSSSGHVSKTVTAPTPLPTSTGSKFRVRIDAVGNAITTGMTVTLSQVKIERGNRATDWTPAPEDVDAATYAINAKIEKLEDSIVSTVNGELTYTAPDGSTQTNELATKVKQTDTSLTATISRTDALETMVHEYSGGVLVSKIKNGATVNGALVNADGSFDVVNVTWNGGTPTVGKKLMRLAKNSIEFNNPDTSYNICNITANGTITNIGVPNGSLAIDEMPAWCQALGDSGYDSFIAGKMLQLGAGNRTTHSEILIEPDGTTIDGWKFALGTNNTTDTWVPVMGGKGNAGYLVHRAINLKWGPNAYAVYGAYNPNNGGDHYYTTNVNEYNKLIKSGWTGSGVYFYAAV